MEEKIPYIAFEGQMARNERHIKRLVIALVVAIVLMFASNALWLWAWMQYDYVETTTMTDEVDMDNESGNVNYIKNGGSIENGASESEDNDNTNEVPDTINREEDSNP